MNETTDSLAAAVATRFERETVPFLAALVEQPSCSREPEDVEAAARLLDARALGLGWRVQRVPDPEGVVADHRVFSPPSLSADAPALVLVGHVDTVFPRSVGFFGFSRDGDLARGPGVLDMKSGLASMFAALEALREARPDRFAELAVRIVVVSDEEIGSRSSRALYESLAPSSSGALVFEAGRAEDALVIARKGVGSFRLTARGRGAHAGLAHAEGANAIEALAHGVLAVQRLTDYERGVTVNVGLIEGGTSSNTVPEHAECTVDCRYIEPADGPALERALRACLPEEPVPGTSLELSGSLHRPPMVETPASRALLERYATHARSAGLGAGVAPLQGGGSDANLLSAAGVPCIDGLGPAGRGVHRTDEQCSLESLRRRVLALALMLAEE